MLNVNKLIFYSVVFDLEGIEVARAGFVFRFNLTCEPLHTAEMRSAESFLEEIRLDDMIVEEFLELL